MAQFIKSTLNLTQHQEVLLFMDIFGKKQYVYLSLVAGPAKADKMASTIASMTATEAAITTYAAANGIDLTQALADGSAAIAAALAGK